MASKNRGYFHLASENALEEDAAENAEKAAKLAEEKAMANTHLLEESRDLLKNK